ncbi:MAG: helicase-related protein [Sphingomonadaceae bacterium]
MSDSTIKAVLGPTNTGKTHLAIERMCAHSSGVMGFPLRLLAREVYDRVVAIKGENAVALITGEERIEPPHARYMCCTAEAMPVPRGDLNAPAFLALDEAQLAADPERGHIFSDRLLHARGREETLLLGSATLEPLIKQLVPEAELVSRPRFSTLSCIGPRKLSRLPPRSAIVAFSAEQVYAMAEMLRRFRGGAAVVMGALSPETRNRQVELFQQGEVDYIVATDAIGMGLNLDLNHIAFASLNKFDGRRLRRLVPAEMAQIAGRAGRHQRDGTFGTLSGTGAGAGGGTGGGTGNSSSAAPALSEEEIYAIEEHRFAPLTRLFWRNPEPRFDSLAQLIADLELPPDEDGLAAAPEAIDLAVLRMLSEDPVADTVRGAGLVRRFWDVCCLPDFRQQGAHTHARFVARLWQDLQQGYIGADFVAARIAELDNVQGGIDTIQGRIAAIRSWAYICQRPDWVLARDEMAARARGVEARLSDALHARLTERFVNRRTAILMRALGQDANLLPVTLGDDAILRVEDEEIGRLSGFHFTVDHNASHEDRRMLLAAGEKALPGLMAERAKTLISSNFAPVVFENGTIRWEGHNIATLEGGQSGETPRITPARDLDLLPDDSRNALLKALAIWLEERLAPLEPLRQMAEAARNPETGSQARALLLTLIDGHGYISREKAGVEHLPREMRPELRRLGVIFGALDIYARDLLKPAPRQILNALAVDRRPINPDMFTVLAATRPSPSGYRPAGSQMVRIDIAEKVLRAAHDARNKARGKRYFAVSPNLGISTGLEEQNFERLLGTAGFRVTHAPPLPEGMFGPANPHRWEWRPSRRKHREHKQTQPREGNAFAGLANLLE